MRDGRRSQQLEHELNPAEHFPLGDRPLKSGICWMHQRICTKGGVDAQINER